MTGPARAGALVVREAGSLEELRADWTRLADEDGDVFRTWEWARAHEDAAGADGRLLLTFARAGEPLLGIARLVRRRPGVLGFAGEGPADHVGPVCRPADRPAVAAALQAELVARRRLLVARGLPGVEGWSELLGGSVVASQPSLVLDLAGRDYDAWLATRSSNFRQQVRGRERKLLRDHALAYRRIDADGELDATMAHLVELHDARWQGESNFFLGSGRALHTAFAHRALERGWLRLWAADVEGATVAYWLGYRFGGDYWFFQLARDPEWERSSIGSVLLAHTVREAFAEGARRYRFLSGDHGYKQRFADGDAGHETVLAGSPLLARPARLAIAGIRRLPDGVRSRLPG